MDPCGLILNKDDSDDKFAAIKLTRAPTAVYEQVIRSKLKSRPIINTGN